MAEKRPRMKSSLQGLSPLAPATEPAATSPVEPVAPAPVAVAPVAPATPATPVAPPAPKAEAKASSEPEKVWPPKTSFYQSSEDGGRMRAAFVNSMIAEGVTSLSEFIGNAVAREVERVEAQYNGGQPWPPVKPQQVPKGPPRRWTT